jgi:molybdopterin molybdotransferase
VIELEEARAAVVGACRELDPQPVDVGGSLGYVLASDVRATEPNPPFDCSSMDGYAVRARDTVDVPCRLRVVAMIPAGAGPSAVVGPGEAARIMTGAPLPAGADAVCMVEHTRTVGDDDVEIEAAVEVGEYVRPAGGDLGPGDLVAAAGTPIGPALVGVLAGMGLDQVLAHPRPRVGVLSTGDELVTGPVPLGPGAIRDSARPALLAELTRSGFEPVYCGTVGDDDAAIEDALLRGARRADAVVTTGGVSVGDLDLVRAVLRRLSGGAMKRMQVAIKPGKPFAFAVLAETGTPVFGLPGNPVSALVSFELLARPALRRMAGHRALDRPRLSAVASADFRRHPDGKLHFVRAAATVTLDGELAAVPLQGQDSHLLHAMAESNSLVLLPDGSGVEAGERVELLLLDPERLGAGLVSPLGTVGVR